MKTRIVTDDFLLDISDQQTNIQEENSRVSDQLVSKFMFPFEKFADDDVIAALGDLVSYESINNTSEIPCYVEHEDKISRAKLNILQNEGELITGQLDFGLEELPNFNKKLSELPLEKLKVDDIHLYGAQIAAKKYPETNFNFPRIFSNKYDPKEKIWDAFNGYINDSAVTDGVLKLRQNYLDSQGEIFNVNVIQPLPSLLYLLKTGFRDAGFALEGDILRDEDLQQAWVASRVDYFSTQLQQRTGLTIPCSDYVLSYSTLKDGTTGCAYEKNISVGAKGKYKITFHIRLKRLNYWKILAAKLYFNDAVIWEVRGAQDFDQTVTIEINSLDDSGFLTFRGDSAFKIGQDYNVLELSVIGDALQPAKESATETDVVTNLNEIDLTRAVPDMTFGTLVTTVKNWFNYDIDLKGNRVIMNSLAADNPFNAKNFEAYEIRKPKREFQQEKSYLLKFPDSDNRATDNMFFDKNGPKLNGTAKPNTSVIEINGFPLPVGSGLPQGHVTAMSLNDDESSLQLVWYDGLTGTDNNAKPRNAWSNPVLFSKRWQKWLQRRLSAVEFRWSFTANIDRFALYSIKDYIYCYKNIHLIKSWNKEKVSEQTYKVDIVTETIT